MEKILPLVKKYGAAIVGLTLDENGIPETGEKRYEIAKRIVKKAEEYGINKEDVYIDCLTLTAAAQQKDVMETLRALSMVKEKLKVKTVLGVSNVSFGFPNRGLLNKTFLAMSLGAGLDLPIINPLDEDMMDTVRAFKVLSNNDEGAKEFLEYYGNKTESNKVTKTHNVEDNLFDIIIKGMKEEAKRAVVKLLQHKEPLEIVNEYIIPALDSVGDKYEKGIIFLPQLVQSAETVKSSFEIIKERLNENPETQSYTNKMILATVKGDIHDIGKNIVKVLLENYGFEIIDLGKDVSSERIIEAAIEKDVKLIGLSALMTTTVKNMEATIKDLKKACPSSKVIVGGAVLNKDYAASIGADYYAKDAKEAVEITRAFFKNSPKTCTK